MAEVPMERRQISYGNLVSHEDFEQTALIPFEVKKSLAKGIYYLFIFVPSEDSLKVTIFPVDNKTIKKILICLKEFSPDLVKGISDVLKTYNLGESSIHTTGLCFSGINCFYETYIDAQKMEQNQISLDAIKKEFKKIDRVLDVQILDIELKSAC
jgi:hypothetical protein